MCCFQVAHPHAHRQPDLGKGVYSQSGVIVWSLQVQNHSESCLQLDHVNPCCMCIPQATGASVVMGLLWILFRFVGPTLGLYDLESGFNDTPNIGI